MMKGALGRRFAPGTDPTLRGWIHQARPRGFAEGGAADVADRQQPVSPLQMSMMAQAFNAPDPTQQDEEPQQSGALSRAAPSAQDLGPDADPDAQQRISAMQMARRRLAMQAAAQNQQRQQAQQFGFSDPRQLSGTVPVFLDSAGAGGPSPQQQQAQVQAILQAGGAAPPSRLPPPGGTPVPPVPPGQQPGGQNNISPLEAARQAAELRTLQMQGGNPESQAAMAQFVENMSKYPTLAMAGAMLEPTKTGGFAESLGKGFGAYSTTGATMADKLLQAQWQREYREQIGQARMDTGLAALQSSGTRAQTELDRAPLIQAQTSSDMARAALETARAAAGTASHVTPGDLQASVMNSLLAPGQINPDTGKPFTRLEAFNATQGATAAGQGVSSRERLGQENIDVKVGQFQQTQEYHDQLIALRQQGLDFQQAKAVLDNATRRVAADLSGKTTMDQALKDAKEGLSFARGQPAPAAPVAPSPAAAPAAQPATSAPAAGARPAWVPTNAVPDSRAPSGWAVPATRPDGTTGLRALIPPAQAQP